MVWLLSSQQQCPPTPYIHDSPLHHIPMPQSILQKLSLMQALVPESLEELVIQILPTKICLLSIPKLPFTSNLLPAANRPVGTCRGEDIWFLSSQWSSSNKGTTTNRLQNVQKTLTIEKFIIKIPLLELHMLGLRVYRSIQLTSTGKNPQ